MARRTQITAADLVERLLSYLGGNQERPAHNDIRRAIVDAYRELVNLHPWTYMIQMGRVFMNATQTDGTVTYDFTGGAYERLLTLDGATWPSWASRGYIRIGTVVSWVDQRIDDTRVTLLDPENFGTDLAAGTSYQIVQDTYELPEDFVNSDATLGENNWGAMTYMSPAEYLATVRYLQTSGGPPRFYSFSADPKQIGRLALRVYPGPDSFQTVDFLYRRKAQDIKTWAESTGKASTAGASTTVTLSDGGVFTQRMVGSIIRLSNVGQVALPTALEGMNPFAEERQILSVTSSSQAVVDEAITDAYTNVGYVISDPLDLELQSMFNAMYAGAIKHLCFARNRKELQQATENWRFMLDVAKESDMRDCATDRASLWGRYQQRLRDMPRAPDQS